VPWFLGCTWPLEAWPSAADITPKQHDDTRALAEGPTRRRARRLRRSNDMKNLSVRAVLAATMLSMFAMVSPVEAATWHVAPAGGAFTGTTPSTWQWKTQGKTTTMTCTDTGTVTGAGGGTANGPISTLQWNGWATLTVACLGATNAGINYTVRCGVANLNANAGGYNGGVSTSEAGSAGLSTEGSLSGILCTLKPTAAPSNNCSTVTGTVPVTYTNPASLAAGVGAANQGSLEVKVPGQSLTMASVGGCVTSIGTGSTTFSALTYTISGSPSATVAAPHIWAN
jgi:hypothetical protein